MHHSQSTSPAFRLMSESSDEPEPFDHWMAWDKTGKNDEAYHKIKHFVSNLPPKLVYKILEKDWKDFFQQSFQQNKLFWKSEWSSHK